MNGGHSQHSPIMVAADRDARSWPELRTLAVRALEATVHHTPQADDARRAFLTEYERAGISPDLHFLLTAEGIL